MAILEQLAGPRVRGPFADIVGGSDPGPSHPLVRSAREPGSDEPDGPGMEHGHGIFAARPKLRGPWNQGTGTGDARGEPRRPRPSTLGRGR